MQRILLALFVLLILAVPGQAGGDWPLGKFRLINSAGFVQQDGVRTPIRTEGTTATAHIGTDDAGNLVVEINGTQIQLFRLERGLAALKWNADETALLHDVDIQALFGSNAGEEVPAWGASIAWPGAGEVQMVLLPLGKNAYTGFLISRPGSKTVVRQMEFRQDFGPSNRPQTASNSTIR